MLLCTNANIFKIIVPTVDALQNVPNFATELCGRPLLNAVVILAHGFAKS